MQQEQFITPPVLPTTITKSELARFLGCHMKTMWRRYLTKELLASWDIDYSTDIKPYYVFDVSTTKKLIEHFNIDPLAWYSIVQPHLVERKAA